ncbi:MAG: AraC family transcriptional regulator [Pseudomonadota bacterium]
MVLYKEIPPCPALAPFVACLWTCRLIPPVSHRVLPDNCIDILWQDGGAGGSVAGMMSCAIEVATARPVRTIAVRFKPGAAAHFFSLPLHELADQHPPLDDVWGAGASPAFDEALWSRPLSDDQALAKLQHMLLRRVASVARPGLAEAALGAIERSHGALRIETLAKSLGVSRQHLASQFRIRVGLGAKQFARVCRFREASARIRATPAEQLDWSRLALDLGYYDQAHLIHEFRALSGSTPESFAAQRS